VRSKAVDRASLVQRTAPKTKQKEKLKNKTKCSEETANSPLWQSEGKK